MTAQLNTDVFFLEEIILLQGQFEAALAMDDLDMARTAFDALTQNAWNAHVMLTGDLRLRCPALGAYADERPMPPMLREIG